MAQVEELWWPCFQSLCQELSFAGPDKQAAIVNERKKYLERGLGYFRQPSKASEDLIRGDQPLLLPDGEHLEPHVGIRGAVLDLSSKLDLDQVQTYILLARLSKDWRLGPVLGPGLDLEQFLAAKVYYFSERLQLLQCIQDVLEAGETETTEKLDSTLQGAAPTLEKQSADSLLLSLQGKQYRAELEGPQLTARQHLLEQSSLCTILALLYYFPRCQPTPERFLELAEGIERHLLSPQVSHCAAEDDGLVGKAQASALVLLIEMLDPERLVAVVGRDEDSERVAQTALRDAATLSRVNELVARWWQRATPAHGPLILVWAAALQLLGERLDIEGPRALAHAELAGQLGALNSLAQLATGFSRSGVVEAEAAASVLLAAVAAMFCAFNLSPLTLPWSTTTLIVQTLCSLFQGQPALCEAFWAQQRPSDPPLLGFLDELRSLFPAQPGPLCSLLAALSSSAPSAASALAYLTHCPTLCTLEDASSDFLVPDPDVDGEVITGAELIVPGVPSVCLAAGTSGKVLPVPEGLPALGRVSGISSYERSEKCIVIWAAPLPDGRSLEVSLERALVAFSDALSSRSTILEREERLCEVASLLNLLAACVRRDATMGHDLVHIRCIKDGDPNAIADPLTLALLALGTLGPRHRELDAKGLQLLGDALSLASGLVPLMPKRIEAALESMQDDVFPGLLERERRLLANSRSLTLALLSLATSLVCTTPAGSPVLKSLVYNCCGLLVSPGSPQSPTVLAGTLRLLRLVLSTPGWEESGRQLLGATLPAGSLAFLIGSVLRSSSSGTLENEASLRELGRAMVVIISASPTAVRMTECLTNAGSINDLFPSGSSTMPGAPGSFMSTGSTPLSVLLLNCARSSWAGPEERALVLQALTMAVRYSEVPLGPALGPAEASALRAVMEEALEAGTARDCPALFAAGCALWISTLEAGPARQAGLLQVLLTSDESGAMSWTGNVEATEQSLQNKEIALNCSSLVVGADANKKKSLMSGPVRALTDTLGSLASLPDDNPGGTKVSALQLVTAIYSSAACTPELWWAIKCDKEDSSSPSGEKLYDSLESLVKTGLSDSEYLDTASIESDYILVESLAAALACLAIDRPSKASVAGQSLAASIQTALPRVIQHILHDQSREERTASDSAVHAAAAVLAALHAACAADAALDRAATPGSGCLLSALLNAGDGAQAVLDLAKPSAASGRVKSTFGQCSDADTLLLRRRLGLLAALAPIELRELESAIRARDLVLARRLAVERRARPMLLAWLKSGTSEKGRGTASPDCVSHAAAMCLDLLKESAEQCVFSANEAESLDNNADVARAQLNTVTVLLDATIHHAPQVELLIQALEVLRCWLGPGEALALLLLPQERGMRQFHDSRTAACQGLAAAALRLLKGTGVENVSVVDQADCKTRLTAAAARTFRPLLRCITLSFESCAHSVVGPARQHTPVASAKSTCYEQATTSQPLVTLLQLATALVDPGMLSPFLWLPAAREHLRPGAMLDQAATCLPALELLLEIGYSPEGAKLLLELGAGEAAVQLLRRLVENDETCPSVPLQAANTSGAVPFVSYSAILQRETWTLGIALVALLGQRSSRGWEALLETAVLGEVRMLSCMEIFTTPDQPLTLGACKEFEASICLITMLLRNQGAWEVAMPGSATIFRTATADFLKWVASSGLVNGPSTTDILVAQVVSPEELQDYEEAAPVDLPEGSGPSFAFRVIGPENGALGATQNLFTWRVGSALIRCVQASLAFQLASAPEVDEQEVETLGSTWVDAASLATLADGLITLAARCGKDESSTRVDGFLLEASEGSSRAPSPTSTVTALGFKLSQVAAAAATTAIGLLSRLGRKEDEIQLSSRLSALMG